MQNIQIATNSHAQFERYSRYYEHIQVIQILETSVWISAQELTLWTYFKDNFLKKPGDFPLSPEAWIKLQKFSNTEIAKLAFCGTSVRVAYRTEFNSKCSFQEGILWAVQKSLSTFDSRIFESQPPQNSAQTCWLVRHYLRTWSLVAKLSKELCRLCSGLPWDLVDTLASKHFSDLAIEVFVHFFPLAMVPRHADNTNLRTAAIDELTRDRGIARTAVLRAYGRSLFSGQNESLPCHIDNASCRPDSSLELLAPLALPVRTQSRLISMVVGRSIHSNSSKKLRNEFEHQPSPFKTTFWRTTTGQQILLDVRSMVQQCLRPTYDSADVLRALVLSVAVCLNIYSYPQTLENLRALLIAVEKRSTGFLKELVGQSQLCGESNAFSAKNK